MGCSWAIAVALWWLLPAGVARVGLIGVPFPCGVGQTFGGVGRFGGFEAWQTAALNAYKRSHCCGRGVLLGGLLEGLEGLRPGKRQPWTPIRGPYSHCCGRGVPLSHCCGLVVAFACGRGACWACWGTFSLRSWADFWTVWGLANGSLERL